VRQRGPLQDEGCSEEVERNAAEPVPLEEGHEEAKPDEHHHVNVLEH